jgi:hypothetical protein
MFQKKKKIDKFYFEKSWIRSRIGTCTTLDAGGRVGAVRRPAGQPGPAGGSADGAGGQRTAA